MSRRYGLQLGDAAVDGRFAIASANPVTVVLISPSGSTNALGRATSLAALAASAGFRVRLLAPNDGTLWAGAAQWNIPIERFRDAKSVAAMLTAEVSGTFVWIVKPLPASWGAAERLMRVRPDFRFVLDVDDDDAMLSEEFWSLSMTNRLKLNPLHSMHPA